MKFLNENSKLRTVNEIQIKQINHLKINKFLTGHQSHVQFTVRRQEGQLNTQNQLSSDDFSFVIYYFPQFFLFHSMKEVLLSQKEEQTR